MHRLQLKWKVTDVIIFCNNYVNKKGKDPMSAIPKDPMILLSYINTQLRDNYSSLEELCQAMDLDEDQIKKTLSDIGLSMSLNKIVFAKKSRFYLSKHDQVKPVFAF